MAKFYFNYATMNTGKSALLLMKAHSFLENNIPILCIKPSTDTRDGEGIIKSRTGMSMECLTIDNDDDIYAIVVNYCENLIGADMPTPKWVLCDEAQFFTAAQVDQLAKIVDTMDINVMCYGLRTDFRTELFEGSKRLFEIADNIEEIKLSCSCGRKAIFNARVDSDGHIALEGDSIEIGGNDRYRPMCRKCYYEKTAVKRENPWMV